MKNLAKIFMAVVLLAGVTSCVQDTTVDEGSGFNPTTTFTVSVDDTRTHLGEKDGEAYPVYWSVGDKLSVNGIESAPLAEVAEGSVKGLFQISGLVDGPYKASYPATAEAGKVLFAAQQSYKEGTFSEGAAVMYGESDNMTIAMQHASGVLQFPIKAAEGEVVALKKVIVTNVNGKLAGLYTAEIIEGELALAADATATSSISYDCGELALSAEPVLLHIAVPAGEYAELKVSLLSTDNQVMNFKVVATGDKAIKPGFVREFNKTTGITFSGNDATFQITDSESLMEFAKLCADGGFAYSGAKVMNNITFDSATYTWVPVEGFVDGLDFDGGNFTITGLTDALFNDAKANVRNLTVNSTLSKSDAGNAHAIIANTFAGTMTNCVAKGSIEHTALTGTGAIAGVIGAASGDVALDNVKNEATVTATPASKATARIGGVMGKSGVSKNTLTFTNCSNSGNITTTAAATDAGETIIGGLIAIFASGEQATIEGCSNSGNITTNHNQASGELITGGLVGSTKMPTTTGLYGEQYNTNSGDILINSTVPSSFTIGGVIGRTEYVGTYQYLKNLAEGSVTVSGSNPVRMDHGGVIGHANISTQLIEWCYNYGTVVYTGVMTNTSTGYYSPTIGGIIGRLNQSGKTVKNCHNHGTVVSNVSSNSYQRFKVGGIIGFSEATGLVLEDCSNNCDLTLSGKTKGVFYAGGIMGHTDKNMTAKNLVNNNALTINFEGSNARIGGVVGEFGGAESTISNLTNNGNVTFDGESTGGNITAGGVIGLTSAPTTGLTNEGAVTFKGTSSTYYHGGGVIGYNTAAASNLLNAGSVTYEATPTTYAATGGVIGYNTGTLTIAEGKTYAAKNNGIVTFSGTSTTEYYGGGVIGNNTADLATVLENAGAVSYTGAATTTPYIGGVIGYTSGDILPAEGKEVAAKNSAATTTFGGTSASYFYFGGVIGKSHIATISGLTNESDITVTHQSTVTTTAQFNGVGGVIGWVTTFNGFGDPGSATKLNATSLKNSGDLTYNGVTTKGTTTNCISGVVGFSNGMLLNGLYNTGVITLGADTSPKSGAEIDFGGCIGQAYFGSINNAYNGEESDTTHEKGKIYLASKKAFHIYAGGVAGYIRVYNMQHSHHYNYAKIECANDFTAAGQRLRLGGVIGWTYKTALTESHNYGNITISSTATNATNQLHIGGIAGRNDQGYTGHTFSTLSNSGAINIDIAPTAGAARAIGGLFGTAEYAATTFTGMNNTGNVTVTSHALNGATGSVGIGGLIGLPTKAITVDNCTVNCNLTAPHANVGMAVGLAYGGLATVTNSTFDGMIQKGDAGEATDVSEDNFFNYIYSSSWDGDSDYAGNKGVKTEGSDADDL